MSPNDRDELRVPIHVPSAWDVTLSPELAPLFVVDAAIHAARRFIEVSWPASSPQGETNLRDLLADMGRVQARIREHRVREQAFANNGPGPDDDHLDLDIEAEADILY
jgi:hypothetical protein